METTICPYCGEEIVAGARKCKHCGEWLQDVAPVPEVVEKPVTHLDAPIPPVTAYVRQPEQNVSQPIVINNTTVARNSNGMGTAGFVLALISALFSWVPGVNLIIWLLGLLFSFIVMFKRPRGLAIAGFIISIIDIIIIVALVGTVASFLSDIL